MLKSLNFIYFLLHYLQTKNNRKTIKKLKEQDIMVDWEITTTVISQPRNFFLQRTILVWL